METADWASHARAERHVHPVERYEEGRSHAQLARHHDLGALPKIGETVWSVSTWRDQWVAPLSRLGAALLPQRALARALIERQAHEPGTVTGHHPARLPITARSPRPITAASRRDAAGAVRRSRRPSTAPTSGKSC